MFGRNRLPGTGKLDAECCQRFGLGLDHGGIFHAQKSAADQLDVNQFGEAGMGACRRGMAAGIGFGRRRRRSVSAHGNVQ